MTRKRKKKGVFAQWWDNTKADMSDAFLEGVREGLTSGKEEKRHEVEDKEPPGVIHLGEGVDYIPPEGKK